MSVKLNSSGGGSVTLTEPTTATDYSVSFRAASGNVVVTPVPAGNSTVAPLQFTSGTNLSTAAAGSMEYDGNTLLFTPTGTQRGVVPGQQYFRLNSNLVGLNVNTAQNILGVGVTLSSNTVYAFEAVYGITKAAGATSHSVSLLFGGTATLNNIVYSMTRFGGGAYTTVSATNTVMTLFQTASASSIADGVTSVPVFFSVVLKGTLSVNSGGTFIPQYILSAAPGGAYTTSAGSYFSIYPIGAAGSNTSVGTWA